MADIDAVIRFLGEELADRRHGKGWTRADLVGRLPKEIHTQTLAAYETAIRSLSVRRLLELCEAMGVSAPGLLRAAQLRAGLQACGSCGEVLSDG